MAVWVNTKDHRGHITTGDINPYLVCICACAVAKEILIRVRALARVCAWNATLSLLLKSPKCVVWS